MTRRRQQEEWVQDATWYVAPTSDAEVHIPEDMDVTSEQLEAALRRSRMKQYAEFVLFKMFRDI